MMLPNNLATNPSLTVTGAKRGFAKFQLAFAIVFSLLCVVFGFVGIVRPMQQMQEAQKWVQIPCVITQSSVVRSMAKRKIGRPVRYKYTLSLAYQYQYGGQSYRDTTYSFDAAQISGYETTYQVAQQLPVGATTTCWVNPSQPEEAVIKREAQQPAWLFMVPLVLFLAGIAVGANALKTMRAPI